MCLRSWRRSGARPARLTAGTHVAGFDIATIPVEGVATNFAYVATTSETGKPLSSLRTIDLDSGATVTEWGSFGVQVLDIAVAVPAI